MPKRPVIELTCDRCGRTWYPTEESDTDTPVSSVAYSYKEILIEEEYDVLCDACASTIKKCVETITKNLKKKAPHRKQGAASVK